MSNPDPPCTGHSGGSDSSSVQVHEWVPGLSGGGGHLLRQGPRYLPAPGPPSPPSPAQGNSGVTSGVVYIESGPKIDQKALFDRKDCTIFGWSLDTTDLQYVLELNEPCFVKLEPLPECEVDCEVQTRVVSLWIGWPKEYASYTHPNQVSSLHSSDKPAGTGGRQAQASPLLGGSQPLHQRFPQRHQRRESPKDFYSFPEGRDEGDGGAAGPGLQVPGAGAEGAEAGPGRRGSLRGHQGRQRTSHWGPGHLSQKVALVTTYTISHPGTLGCWVTTWGRPT